MAERIHVDDVIHSIGKAADACESLTYKRWFWGEALVFDALLLAGEVTGEARLITQADVLLGSWPREAMFRSVQHTDIYAPLRALVRLHRIVGKNEYRESAIKTAEYIVSAPAYRGALLHNLEGYPPMVFVDFLYYVGPYMGLLAQTTENTALLDAAVDQTLSHLECLQDSRDGFVRHVYDPRRRETNGVAWGRGNGWALLGLVDTLELIPAQHRGRPAIEDRFRHLVASCVESQDPSGVWHTILDDPESPLESSTAAFFAAALLKARRLGLATGIEKCTTKAWRATWHRIQSDGRFPISMTEWPDWNPEAYYRRPVGINPWGQGCFLRAASEWLISRRGPQ